MFLLLFLCKKMGEFMRKVNIVIFSSGISEKSGTLDSVVNNLSRKGYNCFCWRDLFKDANNKDNIALLPMLIKKIPTFDFAILICEGHDTTTIYRNGEYMSVPSMRDNVLFEIGLCSMALGLSRVILLSDSKVHMPDDLIGINGKLALKHIIFNNKKIDSTINIIDEHIKSNQYNYDSENIINDIDNYINDNKKYISPVVIGAATSIAIGYANNFIIRLLEHILDGFISNDKKFIFKRENIFFHIIIPEHYDSDTIKRAKNIQNELQAATLPTARHRELNFNFKIEDNDLHIYDYPTSLVASYSTAKMILNIDADDGKDVFAEERFNAKELDLFIVTLKNILREDYVIKAINLYYPNISQKQKKFMIDNICYIIDNNFSIEQIDY